jgi:hypothetical protein
MTGTLHGRSFAEWSKINDVLERHCIGNAKALENALKKPERRIAVVDALNRGRLLGTLPPVEMARGMRHYRMAIMSPLRLSPTGAAEHRVAPPETQSVEFTLDFDPYTQSAVYMTAAPLDLLARIRDFRLPGESEAQAKERHFFLG